MDVFTRTRRLGAVGITGALAASTLAVLSIGTPAGATPGDCRLVQLREPARSHDGSVMDIEVVDGRTVYYGSTLARDKHGVEHQRALVWHGLDGDPVRVGPPGYDEDIAFELTSSGLVNGQSLDWESGREAAWVQDLRTGDVTILATDSGPAGAAHGRMWMRRINDGGSVVGVVGRNQTDPWTDAVTFDHPAASMELLPGVAEAADSLAYGINNQSQKVGYLSTREYEEAPGWYAFDPVVWQGDGSITPMAVTGGLEAIPRAIKDDGSASGSMLYGESLDTGHVEPAYWPEPSTVVPLGVLPGGGFGDVYGMDEGGWLVGALDRGVKRNDRLGERGAMNHAFLWTPSVGEGRVRLLPSLYAHAKGEQDWRRWQGSAVHAVNGELNQAASGSHVEFRYGRAIQAPTVWVNADRCGTEVATTHDPFGLQTSAESSVSSRTATGTGARTTSRMAARAVRAWKRASRR
jgi:hypothetical protein